MTNIALVVLDTLRKDRFNKHFGWMDGVQFENAYSTANWTVPAHASLFTGLYPSEVGTHSKNTTFDYPGTVLAESLSEQGYRTRGFSANMHITSPLNFDRGFDNLTAPGASRHLDGDSLFDWQEFAEQSDTEGINKYLDGLKQCITSDVDTISSLVAGLRFKRESGDPKSGTDYGGANEAIEEITQMEFGDDEFLFLNLMEAHEPYQVPDKYQSVPEPELTDAVGDLSYGDKNDEDVIQAYDDCSRYLSDRYKDVFQLLSDDFDYIITVSDHGEMLGENNMWGHEYGIHQPLTHVPLVISGSAVEDESRTESVSIVDIHSTILQLAGVKTHEGRGSFLLEGESDQDHLTEYRGLTSWSESALKNNGYENLMSDYDTPLRGITTGSEYYYETQSGVESDSGGNTDAAQDRLDELVSDLNQRGVRTDNEVPDEIKDQLEDLGYA